MDQQSLRFVAGERYLQMPPSAKRCMAIKVNVRGNLTENIVPNDVHDLISSLD